MEANVIRLQLNALAYNRPTFCATLGLPLEIEHWPLATLRDKLVKIGAKVIAHTHCTTFQMAEVAVPHDLLGRIPEMMGDLLTQP